MHLGMGGEHSRARCVYDGMLGSCWVDGGEGEEVLRGRLLELQITIASAGEYTYIANNDI